jgi:hypothetical protein
MTLKNRIVLFVKLGNFLRNETSKETLKEWAYKARNENGWFTEDNVAMALDSIAHAFLSEESLQEFSHKIKPTQTKSVGLICAGNIPLVGFHDLLCVLLAGHKALLKLSSSDSVLMKFIIAKLIDLDPEIKDSIEISERLNSADAFIATGSDNSARYFEYYFKDKPSIIRKNRSSVAVFTGNERTTDLRNLGNDLFRYFGLGCRNISKVYVPKGYKFDTFFESIEYWNTISIHHKYVNNYDYNKSIYLINGNHHYDNGFLLVTQNEGLVSPLAVLFYEEYSDKKELDEMLLNHTEKLQCIVGTDYTPFGQSQTPKIDAFADKVNTLDFLAKL